MVWKLLTVFEGVVIAVLVTILLLGRDRFVHLGNNMGDSTYLMLNTRTGQACYGGPKVAYLTPITPLPPLQKPNEPAKEVNPIDAVLATVDPQNGVTKEVWEKSYKGTGLPYCVDLH